MEAGVARVPPPVGRTERGGCKRRDDDAPEERGDGEIAHVDEVGDEDPDPDGRMLGTSCHCRASA
jgi:hypothetical protein